MDINIYIYRYTALLIRWYEYMHVYIDESICNIPVYQEDSTGSLARIYSSTLHIYIYERWEVYPCAWIVNKYIYENIYRSIYSVSLKSYAYIYISVCLRLYPCEHTLRHIYIHLNSNEKKTVYTSCSFAIFAFIHQWVFVLLCVLVLSGLWLRP